MAFNKQSGAWAVIYCPPTQGFLLGRRSLAVKKPHLWNFFGGRVDPGEMPLAALLRELKEEVGFGADVDGNVDYGGTCLTRPQQFGYVDGLRELHYFLLLTEREVLPRLNEEHCEFDWFQPSKLPRQVNRATAIAINIGLIQKAQEVAGTHASGKTADDGDFGDLE